MSRSKRVLITGKGSYVGTRFIEWLRRWGDMYEVDEISVRGEDWKKVDFSQYHTVLHVAGIAHVSADPSLEDLYYNVNRDLAIEVAKKAKEENVQQFIFMSSIIVYGNDGYIGESKIITPDTKPNPADFYGKSKLEADLAIQQLNSNKFKTVIVRAPLIYGPNCKGNFPKLIKISKYIPIFFDLKNERSMIYIKNLCEFLRLIIENKIAGVFYPQNKEYVSTVEIIEIAAKVRGKKIYLIKIFNPVLKLISPRLKYINKIFGNKAFVKDISSNFEWEYNLFNFQTSIEETIKEWAN